MHNKINLQNHHTILRILMVVFFAFNISACDTPEKAAKILRKKVQEKATQICFSQKINVDQELEKLECIIAAPSISESISEKTELISSW
ncbi:MAG: hypothetical protein EAZ13_01145 [Sphingobacteriia bacterium]|nr:MAG: hypothetical protein EAZ41_05240 [Sphingobacteriia bacterium]TAG32092.1 MAG: hypothetical protein EAZ35_00525 [Sphingobacteriia bacterium]TAH09377.1 MAG: hypothetical protein EAZ13_01145 [Sphingobacteriia bacterium]